MTSPLLVEKILLSEEIYHEISTLIQERLDVSGFVDRESVAIIKTSLVQLLILETIEPFPPDTRDSLRLFIARDEH